ncbi:MAG: hypothetical protein GF307_07440 [candidate division Zixibacteria bacterium]|nr:hypothetical protein [candidate division Zixibacteria bacterium]
MRVKKFIAGSVPEALSRIKKEMGDDAVILNTRTLAPTGPSDSRKGVEVTAAVDYPEPASEFFDTPPPVTIGQSRFEFEPEKFEQHGPAVTPPPSPGSVEDTLSAPFIGDLGSVTDNINTDDGEKNDGDLQQVNEMFSDGLSRLSAEKYLKLIPAEVDELYRQIAALNIDPEFIDEMVKDTLSGRLTGDGDSPLQKRWAKHLAENCPSIGNIENLLKKRPMAFTGNAGCGRSTLIAKIALSCLKDYKIPVSIISLDGFNVSGQHQMRRFAKILKINFFATSKLTEVVQRIEKNKSGEALLIDLPALDTGDETEQEFLREIAGLDLNKVLVLNASQHYSSVKKILASTEYFNFSHLALSNLENDASPGMAVTAIIKSGLTPLIGGKGREINDGYEPLKAKPLCTRVFENIVVEDSDE